MKHSQIQSTKSKPNDLLPIDFHPQRSKMKVKKTELAERNKKKGTLDIFIGREREETWMGMCVCVCVCVGRKGRRDAHLWPVGQSRSAGVWGFDFPPGLHLCVCVCACLFCDSDQ